MLDIGISFFILDLNFSFIIRFFMDVGFGLIFIFLWMLDLDF